MLQSVINTRKMTITSDQVKITSIHTRQYFIVYIIHEY